MESDEKDSLQLRKLALEIAELERPWWKRPSYILGALPTVLAVIALSVGFLNGFFSAQLTKLENQRHDLEVQIRDFQKTRDQLNEEVEKLRAQGRNFEYVEKRAQFLDNRAVQCEDELKRLKNKR